MDSDPTPHGNEGQFWFATTKSSLPSPLKSPMATEKAPAPAPKLDGCNAIGEVEKVTSKNATFEVPPPGLGLTTVTDAVPALATSEERMVAFSWDLVTNVVVRVFPFQFTTAPETKPVPLTVKVNPAPPGLAASGTSGWLIRGTGFCAMATPLGAETVRHRPHTKARMMRSRMSRGP